MLASPPRLSPVAILVIGAAVAVLVAWRVLAVGFAGLLEGTARGDPLLDEVTRDAAPPADIAWRARIARFPMDANAFLQLALVLEKQGNKPEAQAAMDEALRLDPTHPNVLLGAAEFQLRAGNPGAALPLLRRRMDVTPDLFVDVWPIFVAELESGRATDYLIGVGRENPPWFPSFVGNACNEAVAPDALVKLVVARADAGVVTDAERACLIGRLQRDQRWADARVVWLGSLPKDSRDNVGHIFNGDFEHPPSKIGFDWFAGEPADTQPTEGAHGKRALRVAYGNKRYDGPPIYQNLMVPPGRYSFAGNGRADAFESWLGLQWGLYCAPTASAAPRQLTRTEPFTGSTGWTPFAREFTVPPDCPVQVLRLELANPHRDATTPGNVVVRLRGTLWFDDLRIDAVD